MKTKRLCKSTVSMILTLIMLVSMITVAFVNVSAAETEISTTGATITGGTTFYLKPNDNWKSDGARFAAYFCNGTSAAHWYSAFGPNDDGNYWVTVNPGESHANIVWCRMSPSITTNDWNNGSVWNQTNDLTWDGTNNLYTVAEGAWSNGGGSWSTYTPTTPTEPTAPPATDPTDPDDPADKITISFLINSDTKWIATDDAKMFIKSGSDVVEMSETVDTKSGHIMWTAEVDDNSSYTFYRTSYFFDETNATTKAWNSWTASSRGTNTVYKVGDGSWAAASTVNAADPEDINNFWDDLWIDTVGDGKTENAVKVYYTGSTFHLYVPSYVDLSDVTVYSDHEKVVIGGVEYASGTKANLSTGTKTFQFKDGSTTTNKGNITIYQTTDTAAMLMTTKEELYTGTTGGLASDNAWPSGSGITSTNFNSVYKDAIETKGSYYFYTEDGAWLNDNSSNPKLTTLKKIKGRGNSSFEASMRIYGKYAYNFNLDEKIALIDGATAAKKWCLLANNPDITMMRNTFVYSLADDIGIKYSPETRLLDLYDNGKYLGAYILTEKVEYGKNTLMKDMKNLDDGNEEANSVMHPTDEDADPLYEFDTDDLNAGTTKTEAIGGTNYTYKYYTTFNRPAYKDENGNTVAAENNVEYKSPENYNTKYNYLLEFELYNRYENEASWFKSSRTGQAVVVKYPEFVTEDEMKWIISEYEAAEAAIYSNDTTAIQNTVDVDSFAKMYLIQELAINLDSCATSYYIHNDLESGKLVSSPVWDYDWAFGAYSNTTDSGKKYVYKNSSVQVNSTTIDNPKQMFVKDKALKTDSGDNTKTANYNFQAKLVHNDYVWERCKYFYTNEMAPALYSYLIDNYSDTTDTGKIVSEWLPKFQSSIEMNNARWGAIAFTGDNWGTKVTTDYTKGSGLTSSTNFKIGDTSSSGSASKNYANSVYYLNDWLVVRKNYLSSSSGGNLYDATLVDPYRLNSVTLNATQNGDDVVVSVDFDATYNGTQVEDQYKKYELYVNGTLYGDYAITATPMVKLNPNEETSIYVVAYLRDDKENYNMTSATKTFTYTVTGPEYKVEDVEFTAVQNEGSVTVTPSAIVTEDGVELASSDIEYTVYVNDTVAVTKTLDNATATVIIPEGQVSKIYIKVNPVGVPTTSGTSATQEFAFNVEVETVTATLYFKSSSSVRYIPYVTVGSATEKVAMTKSGDAIGKNASQTQSYYWYTANVTIPVDTATKITFTNGYSMNAPVTLTLSSAQTYYFAVDNLNQGTKAVDLTDANDYVKNFVKSATHMVTNDPTATGLATTSIDGKILKMGDTDEDNILSIIDATNSQRALAGKIELSETAQCLSDYDLNGVSSIMDVTNTQMYLAQ